MAAFLVPFLLYVFHRKGDLVMLTGLLVGLPLGRYFDETYLGWQERASFRSQMAKGVIGALGFWVLRYGVKVVFRLIYPQSVLLDIFRYALIGLWITYGAPFLFVKAGLQYPEPDLNG